LSRDRTNLLPSRPPLLLLGYLFLGFLFLGFLFHGFFNSWLIVLQVL